MFANANRNPDIKPTPFEATDFIPWHAGPGAKREAEDEAPILLDDPIQQGALIRAVLFGLGPSDPLNGPTPTE